ncbi:MAG: amino acid-binding protein [Methanomicrobiales archaeon]|nr:amino acid-binding protein [Methanomicrobiales archaeon]
MKLEMKDTPGQLVRALKPISDTGGNIIAVIHQRESLTRAEVIDVQVVIELPEKRLEELVARMNEQGVTVQRIGTERLIHKKSLILIGHIMHTDLTDTVDHIDTTGYAEVSELELIMPAIAEPSSARMMIKATNAEAMNKALEILRQVARKKDILVIESLEENG